MSVVTLLLVAWRDEQIRPDLPQHIIGVIAGVVVLVVAFACGKLAIQPVVC